MGYGVHIANKRDAAAGNLVNPVDVTSASKDFGRYLSPFLLGPVALYNGKMSRNVENAWQYSKVYPEFADTNGKPTPEYWKWAEEGWQKRYADRHPLGINAKPLYSLWSPARLDYLAARKNIYIPLYASAAVSNPAFYTLKEFYEQKGEITLVDYDGYNLEKDHLSIQNAIDDPTRPLGHSFVLEMLLDHVKIQNPLYVNNAPYEIKAKSNWQEFVNEQFLKNQEEESQR
jgi:hypothetical protein